MSVGPSRQFRAVAASDDSGAAMRLADEAPAASPRARQGPGRCPVGLCRGLLPPLAEELLALDWQRHVGHRLLTGPEQAARERYFRRKVSAAMAQLPAPARRRRAGWLSALWR